MNWLWPAEKEARKTGGVNLEKKAEKSGITKKEPEKGGTL